MGGLFGVTSTTSNSGKANESKNYYFSAASKDNSSNLFLSTNDVYFSSGYDQLLSQAEGFSDRFVIEARMLLKFLGTTRHHALAAPMIVQKKGTWELK